MSTREIDLRGRTLRQHAARGAAVNAAFLIVLSALSLLKGFVVAGFVSREDYGLWGIVAVSVTSIINLKQVGVGDRYLQQDEEDQEVAFQEALTVEVIFTAGFAVIICGAIPLVALAYGRTDIIAPSFVLALILPAGALQASLWVFYRRMQFVRQRVLQAIDPVVGFVVSVGLAVAGAGYWSLVLGIVAGSFSASIAAVFSSPYPLRLRPSRTALLSYWRFSWPLFVTSLATLVLGQAAFLLSSHVGGVGAAGAVALAATVSQWADRVDGIVTGTLYPAICAVRDRRDLLLESFVKSNRLALMWGMPFGVGLSLFAGDLIRLGLGEEWRPALVLLQVFGLTAAFGHIGFNWDAYFRARGETKPMAILQIVVAFTFLVAAIPLALAYGLDGFAGAVGIMTFVTVATRAYFLRRIFPAFVMARHAARAIAPTVPAAGVVLAVRALARSDDRPIQVVIGELTLYLVVTAAATWAAERSLLLEARGYLRRRNVPTLA